MKPKNSSTKTNKTLKTLFLEVFPPEAFNSAHQTANRDSCYKNKKQKIVSAVSHESNVVSAMHITKRLGVLHKHN